MAFLKIYYNNWCYTIYSIVLGITGSDQTLAGNLWLQFISGNSYDLMFTFVQFLNVLLL